MNGVPLAPPVPFQGTVARKKFTYEEDQKLLELVTTYGAKKWRRIAEMMPGRTPKQCRDRYCDYLNPEYFNGQWTNEEDEKLREKFREYGPQWTKIAQFFTNRNANSIRNRWSSTMCRDDSDMTPENSTKTKVERVQLPSINELLKEVDHKA